MQEKLPPNTPVFTFANDPLIIAFDKYTCVWCEDIANFKKSGFNLSAEDTREWLLQNGYTYLIIDGQTAQRFGANETNAKIQGLLQTAKFTPVMQNSGIIILALSP